MSSRQERHWNRFVLACWMLLFSMWGLSYSIPSSAWFELTAFTVADAKLGTDPEVKFTRKIVRDFTGTYYSTVYRQNSTGWGVWCITEPTTILFHASASLPDHINTKWWFYPKSCPAWDKGTFRIETAWEVRPEILPARMVRISSNEFRID